MAANANMTLIYFNHWKAPAVDLRAVESAVAEANADLFAGLNTSLLLTTFTCSSNDDQVQTAGLQLPALQGSENVTLVGVVDGWYTSAAMGLSVVARSYGLPFMTYGTTMDIWSEQKHGLWGRTCYSKLTQAEMTVAVLKHFGSDHLQYHVLCL